MEKDQAHYAVTSNYRAKAHYVSVTILIVVALVFAGCSDNSTGTNGGDPGNGNGNGNGDGNGTTIGTEPTFTNVQEIFNQNCGGSGCHIGGRTNGVRLDGYDNVVESEGSRYGELVVQAGDAEGSPLVDKIEDDPQNGVRMPQGGPYLSQERIDQIKEWINDGAEND